MRILSFAGIAVGCAGILLATDPSGATGSNSRPFVASRTRSDVSSGRRPYQGRGHISTPAPCSTNYPAAGDYFVGVMGESDVAGGRDSAVAGGYENLVCVGDSGILNGELNSIGTSSEGSGGDSAAIASGRDNKIDQDEAFIGAGSSNYADGSSSFIGAGANNTTSGSSTFVGAGAYNSAGTTGSFVGAGIDNAASGYGSFIGSGGFEHYIASSGSLVTANQVSGTDSFVGAGDLNGITGNGSFIGAGDYTFAGAKSTSLGNQIPGNDSFIGAGDQNVVSANEAFLGSGQSNFVEQGATYGVIAGGDANDVSGEYATVTGGNKNVIAGEYGAVLGGYGNTASGAYGVVAGGNDNAAAGTLSFAGGYHADATHNGSFVWSDYSSGSAPVKDAAANQFIARASGGIYLYSNEAATSGAALTPGSGTWASLSDRNAKTAIVPLNDASILAKVDRLPISVWSYKTESGVKHVGPMAQDFYAAFGTGVDDRHITSIDEDGVALAAIKALHRENAQLRNELGALRDAVRHLQHAADRTRKDSRV